MVNLPTKRQLEELQAFDGQFCLTIYAPFIEPSGATENPIRIELKNMLKQGELALRTAGVSPREVAKTTRAAWALLDTPELRATQRQSFALFMHPHFFRSYHIPDVELPYALTVQRGFNTEPLISVMAHNQAYYLLALSHKNVQLYRGDQFNVLPVRSTMFPMDMKQALHIDELPRWRETHQIGPAGAKGSAASHGQYNVAQTDKVMLHEFFRRIDRRLHRLLARERLPLVIAGVEYLLPIYRQVNTSPYLLPDSLVGNVDRISQDALRRRAWPLVERQLASAQV